MNKFIVFYLCVIILVFTSFENVFLKGQLLPNSETTTLTIKDIPQSYIQNVSQSWVNCAFDLYFIVTTSDPTDEILSLTSALKFPTLLLKDGQSNLYYMQISSQQPGARGYTIQADSKNGVSVVYTIDLNCLTYDLDQIELSENNLPQTGFPGAIVTPFNFKNFPGMWSSGVSSSSISTIGLSTNSYYVIWPQAIVSNNFDQNWTNTITVQARTFNISSKSIYGGLPIEEVSNINVYPPTSPSVVKLSGLGYTPLVTFISNSNSSFPFLRFNSSYDSTLKPISGSRGSIKYIGAYTEIFADGVTTTNYSLSYQTGAIPTTSSYDFSKIYKKFNIPVLPSLVVNNYSDPYIPLFTAQFSAPTINNLNIYSVTLTEFDLNIIPKQNFPFGFGSGNNLNLIYKVAFPQRLQEYQVSKIRIQTSVYETTQTIPDNFKNASISAPIMTSYQFTKIYNDVYLIRLSVKDSLGISAIFTKYAPASFARLVSGTIYDGEYELIATVTNNFVILIENIARKSVGYQNGAWITLNPIYRFFIPSSINVYLSFNSFKNVSFLENNLNLNNQSSYNVFYFNSTDLPIDKPMYFSLGDPVSTEKKRGKRNIDYPIVYNETLKMFNSKFIVPKNTMFGDLQYSISAELSFILGNALENPVSLTISSTYLDNYGPIFSDIEKVPSDSAIVTTTGKAGWRFTIQDDYNGFDRGYIKVMGAVDSSYYHFNFTFDNDEIGGGNRWNGVYDILFPVTDSCFGQDFVITQVFLYDTNGVLSEFGSSGDNNNPNPMANPFINYIGNERANRITITCTNQINDQTPPELVNFTVSTNQNPIDVGSANRLITFNFEAKDMESGLKDGQTPVVYISSRKFEIAECISREIFSNVTHKRFECTIELDIGFAFPSVITYSIYGFINNGGYYDGFTAKELKDQGLQFYSNVTYSIEDVVINQIQPFTSEGGQLIIYGKGLNNVDSLNVNYFDEGGLDFNNTYPIFKSSDSYLFVNNIKPTTMPFKIVASSISGLSNEFTVYPIYFNINYPPPTLPPVTTETPTTPTPTSSPVPIDRCLGEPKCGGPTQGYCNLEIGGCVCYSPWIGTSCSSQVIIVPKPDTNTTDPTVTIPIVPGSNSNVFYKSLISLVSLRELDYNQQQVKLFTFEKWIFSEINENKNKYETNITTTDGEGGESITTNITVVIEWFKDESIVQFAGSNLTMNPSTIKYTIYITEYAFSSNLNQLQLITSALFESDSDNSCSSKEFGSTTNGDNSNFVKIQIQDHSLYGRFIKRAIIDKKITTISNSLLDSSLNVIASSSAQQTFIAINIPNFISNVTLDPDFSVLVDSNSVSNDNENSICKPSSSGLSTPQLAGIIIGSVAFVAVAAIIGVYFVVQKRKDQKFHNKMNNRLSSMQN